MQRKEPKDFLNDEWEVIGANGTHQSQSIDHCSEPTLERERVDCAGIPIKESVIRPMCLCINQKNTRIGVGHETGYLVFRVKRSSMQGGSNEAESTMSPSHPVNSFPTGASAGLSSEHTHFRLELDPSYNVEVTSLCRKKEANNAARLFAEIPPKRMEISRSAWLSDDETEEEDWRDYPDPCSTISCFCYSYKNSRYAGKVGRGVPRKPSLSRRSRTVPDSAASRMITWNDDEEDRGCPDEDATVGFSGGGVCAMALLYEQAVVAVVGGGPTPVGPPHVVLLFRGGVQYNSVSLLHPVVRVFLDARLLFVCTTQQLVVYTNPTEKEWTTCGYTMPFEKDSSAPGHSIGENVSSSISGAAPMLSHSGLPSGTGGTSFPTSMAESSPMLLPSVGSTAAQSLPAMPLWIDYGRNLLLLRSPNSSCGFTLLHYTVTDTQPVPGRLAGRSTVFVSTIATQNVAHKNTVSGLALYVGRAPQSTSSISVANSFKSSENSLMHGDATYVATSSVYGTRIVLWVLDKSTSNHGRHAFVHWREFRVGLRVPTHPLIHSGAGSHSITHLQFIGGARYIFCVRGTEMHLFSTAADDPRERKNVCREHLQASQNHQSVFSNVTKMLNLRLTYTEQDWPSCGTRLPMQDPFFYPCWLYIFRQDAAAASTTAVADHKDASLASTLMGKVGRYLATYTPTVAMGAALWSRAEPRGQASGAVLSTKAYDAVQPTATPVWGQVFTDIASCLLLWESEAYSMPFDVPSLNCAAGRGERAQPNTICMNCVTCDGVSVSVRIYAQSGKLLCTPAVRPLIP